MTHVLRSMRLYLANRTWSVLTPIYILAIMTGITVVITAIIGIATGLPIPDDIRHDMRFNGGAIYCIPGFLISVGALAMNRNFSMALALGSTRRHFWIGTALGFVITSLTLGVGSLVGLGLERLTNHWFIGARAFDVTPLGDGDVVQTFTTTTILALLSLFLGALFGTVFRAFGAVWTTVTAIGLGLLLAGAAALVVASWSEVVTLIGTLGPWLLLNIAAVLALLAAAGSYVVNRLATV